MARTFSNPGGGWTLRQKTEGGVWLVRFTLPSCGTIERSTGTRDIAKAKTVGAQKYAHWIAREPEHRPRNMRRGALDLAVAEWLVSIESIIAESTRDTWTTYARAHWIPRWDDTSELTAEAMLSYRSSRLKKVEAETVKHEFTAMRSFLKFLKLDIPVPSIGKRTVGTPHAVRRRKAAPEGLTDPLVRELLAKLPEWSTSRKVPVFAIQARFLVGYYTSLRPSTLDKLRMRRHYERGSTTLLIEPRIDKARFGRELPLPEEARKALDTVCSMILKREAKLPPDERETEPLIFGKHDYREHLAEAAKDVLPKHIASRFAGTHLRSARLTDVLEASGNVPGAQYMAGHKTLAATTRYIKPTMRAAVAMLEVMKARTVDEASAEEAASRATPRKRKPAASHAV